MRTEHYLALKKYITNIEDFTREIKDIEAFFENQNIDCNRLDLVFWNHMLSLFNRIDQGEQNNLELGAMDEVSKQAEALGYSLIESLKAIRNFELTEMERLLINIHMAKILEGGDLNE